MNSVDVTTCRTQVNTINSNVMPGDYVPLVLKFRPEGCLNVPFNYDNRSILPDGRVLIPNADAYYRCDALCTQITTDRPLRGKHNDNAYYSHLVHLRNGDATSALETLSTTAWHVEIYRDGESYPNDTLIFQHPEYLGASMAGTDYSLAEIDRDASQYKDNYMCALMHEQVVNGAIWWHFQTTAHPNYGAPDGGGLG